MFIQIWKFSRSLNKKSWVFKICFCHLNSLILTLDFYIQQPEKSSSWNKNIEKYLIKPCKSVSSTMVSAKSVIELKILTFIFFR